MFLLADLRDLEIIPLQNDKARAYILMYIIFYAQHVTHIPFFSQPAFSLTTLIYLLRPGYHNEVQKSPRSYIAGINLHY